MIIERIIFSFLLILSLASEGQDFWEEIILPDTLSMSYSDILFDDEGTVYLGTLQGLFKSFDNGLSWNSTGLNKVASLMTMAPDNTIFTITMCEEKPCLCKSNDYGETWYQIHIWEDIPHFSCAYMTLGYNLIFGAMGGLFISSDSGYTWTQALTNYDTFQDVAEEGDTLLAGSINFLDPNAGGIYHSLDSGNSWQQISLPGYGVSSFALDSDSNMLCGVNFQYNYLDFGVLRSLDNGYTWQNILSDHIVTSLAVDANGGIYAGCDSDFGPEGVQYSSDNGFSWESINSGLHDNASITSLAISPNGYIYATTIFPSKLYRSVNPNVNLIEPVPKDKNFHVFPNPCNDLIHINLKVHSGTVSNADILLRIFNPLGVVLLDKKIKNNSDGIISLDISSLNQGIYFMVIAQNFYIYSVSFIKM